MPPPEDVRALARDLLAAEGTRLPHVRTAGRIAGRLSLLFADEEAELLVTAANLHDIGYSARIAHLGFHPLDGARFLLAEGFPARLAGLVANHSLAILHADPGQAQALAEEFPREDGLVADALSYADMHSAPDGRLIAAQHRLADIVDRHADPRQAHRAARLRIAMARVGAALLEAQRPSPEVVDLRRRRWIDLHDWSAGTRAAAAASAGPDPGDPVRSAFDAWWSAESQYRAELAAYERQDAVDVREAALRLVHLRTTADDRRDGYFRRALG
jgi:hypothetical protein